MLLDGVSCTNKTSQYCIIIFCIILSYKAILFFLIV